MKLIMFTRYTRLGASSRVRCYQYLPSLTAAGINVTISPLFSDTYVKGLRRNRKALGEVLTGYDRRIKMMLRLREFDVIWIEKEALPWFPFWLERMLLPTRIPYLLDYDDAVFHYYDQSPNSLVRALLANKHPRLMRAAAAVIVGNDYIGEFARRARARGVEKLPTVVDLERYSFPIGRTVRDGTDQLCVGWIGQESTASYLAPYKQLFERLAATRKFHFVAVGIDARSKGLPMQAVPWTEDSEVATLSDFDVGIMPLIDGPFERGKCGYKLIQYMACGLPVVASPVAVNNEIVERGINGFLPSTPEEWEQALLKLLADPDLRRRMGASGRQKVEREYSLSVAAQKFVGLLMEAVNG